jgi:hypothetical protein
MKRFLYIFIVLLCSQVVWASKPIQIFVQLQAPHSPYLYEYANSGSHKMSVQIQVLDSRLMNHPVRVEMYVEKLGQGIVMKTNPAVNIPPKGYGASRNTTEYHNQAILRAMDAQERIHNLRINNDNIEYKIIKHGLFESALTPNSEGISEVAQQFVEWYVRHEFGMSASSPADTYFKIGKNEVVYQETLNTIDKIGLLLMPLGLDIITDGIGAIYAGYYYDIETASYYVGGVVVAGVSGAVFRQLATRSKKISRVSGEFKIVDNVVHQSDDIASYMGKIPKELQKKLDALPDGGHKFLDDFANAPDDILKKFLDNPELVEAWKKMDNLGADDVLRRNTGALEALNTPKGSRPDPNTYLSQKYIDDHLKKFDDGAVRFTTDKYPTLGTDEAFVMPKSEFDKLMTKTGGDLSLIEKELALKEGTLTGDNAVIAWIKKEDFSDIRMSSGRETGANPDLWIPGGKTANGGWSEAVMDLSNPNISKTLFPF